MEPVYLVEIQAHESCCGGIYSTLQRRRGRPFERTEQQGQQIHIKAHLPVEGSFGFTEELRTNTSGRASPQCVFDHWEMLGGDPLQSGKTYDILTDIRQRKGLRFVVSSISEFEDR